MKNLINEEFERTNTEILETVMKDLSFSEKRSKLRILSEAEELEDYNRRENVTIYAVAESTRLDSTGIKIFESNDKIMEKLSMLQAKLVLM